MLSRTMPASEELTAHVHLRHHARIRLRHTHGWGRMNGWGGGWMWPRGTPMVFFWVAIFTALVWFLTKSPDAIGGRPSRAKEILEERCASGEFSTEEYRERLDHLR